MPPATHGIAMSLGVLVALKAFKDVVAIRIARVIRQARGRIRTHAAAADEHDQRLRINLTLQLDEKMRITHAARILIPFNFNGIRNPANPIPFGSGSHINQFAARRQVQNSLRLERRQCPLVRKAQSFRTLLREGQDFS